jgi:hypothetical protein
MDGSSARCWIYLRHPQPAPGQNVLDPLGTGRLIYPVWRQGKAFVVRAGWG